ncbi:hypothetical protein HaLaN_01540, partial [Haematococcus lacustris]
MEVLEERLAALSAQEEAAAADLRLCKGQLASAQSQLVTEGALGITQQQVDWYQCQAGAFITKYLAYLASCPESGRTDLQAAMQQLQQAKSSTLFLVAQQQAPSHTATTAAAEYVDGIRRHMQQQLEQQLGLDKDAKGCRTWQPRLLAVAAAMTRVNLLVSGLQGSCPGLQL